ncbi:MAG TPA: serine/threonine-protein kinase [Gaiellales bacterium]|nr:serine/threonine-protein kinase [Gaiellales bacterium]
MERGPRVGTVFAGYRIDAVLGQGGMGVVYRATHPRLGSVVAIKAMDLRLSRDESQRERFLHEAHIAASLNHPNVIPIFDAGYEGDELYIVMRYVAGADLGKALRARGPLDVPTTAHLLRQAGRGLDAAHKRGLVHRDVKPANLLLEAATAELLDAHLYVADFGLVAVAEATGTSVGTAAYMAPEQIEGGPVDPGTDVYALGCVAYECLCGVPPFSREADAAVLWAHMQEDPTPPSAVRSELPRSVDQAIARAMAKDPADRYRSCAELADALSEPGDGRRPRVRRRRRPPIGRRAIRRGLLVVAALLLATLAVAAVLHFSAGESTGSPPASSNGDSGQHSTLATTATVSVAALTGLVSQAGVNVRACGPVQDELSTGSKWIYCRLHGKQATANGAAVSLTIHMYPHPWFNLYAHYREGVQRHRANDPLLAPENSQQAGRKCGRLAGQWHYEDAWRRTGPSIQIEANPDLVSMIKHKVDGRIMCWVSNKGMDEIEWTLNDRTMYLLATVDGRKAPEGQAGLYRWWAVFRNRLAPSDEQPG